MDADTLAGYLALAAEANKRAEQATAGPWNQPAGAWCDLGEVWPATRPSTQEGMAIAYDITRSGDAAFIAAARTDIPALCAAVESLATEVQRLVDTSISFGEQAVRATAQAEQTFKVLLRVRQQRDALRWPHDFGLNSARTGRTTCMYCDVPYTELRGTPCTWKRKDYQARVEHGDLNPAEQDYYSDAWLEAHP